jgi:hypothetical protein
MLKLSHEVALNVLKFNIILGTARKLCKYELDWKIRSMRVTVYDLRRKRSHWKRGFAGDLTDPYMKYPACYIPSINSRTVSNNALNTCFD